MHNYIKAQLDKCKVADIPQYNDDTVEILIKSQTAPKPMENAISTGSSYLFKVADYIIHPSKNFALHANWNNGVVPTDDEMYVTVTQMMGRMIKVEAVGKNDKKPWNGWLPYASIEVVERK